ncbi:MAG: nucleotidyl transferase AbiEii/AbiGii toxin family protein [Clostridia bacterium]
MNIERQISEYIKLGLAVDDAAAKVCGEIVLYKIAKSSNSRNVTIKGGVVMMNIAKNLRRATRDLDLDFIKYSLTEDSIVEFINKLNNVQEDIKLAVIFPIIELKHQDYKGKRVVLSISDNFQSKYEFKLDIGVHRNLDLIQEELCFDFNSISESVTLLVNSKEQILAEKLKSLLKFGSISNRFKDIFDMYYLIKINPIDKNKFRLLLDDYIIDDEKMWENNYEEIYKRLFNIFQNKHFYSSLSGARDNWLELPVEEIIKEILTFFEDLIPVMV